MILIPNYVLFTLEIFRKKPICPGPTIRDSDYLIWGGVQV